MTKTKKVILIAGVAFVLLAAVGIATLLKYNKKQGDVSADYLLIDDVPGCSFAVNKLQTDTATAVTEISKNISFTDYETYTYKNGKDLYIQFNMRRYVVIAKKGTNFFFSRNPVEQTLQLNNLQGIWFTPAEKSKLKKNGNTYALEVNAAVTITNTLYNDFKGTLTTFERDGAEWSLFVGYVQETDEESVEMVKYIQHSFAPVNDYRVDVTDFKVDIETAEKIEEVEVTAPEEEASEEVKESLAAKKTEREVTEDKGTAYSSNKYSMLPVGATGYMDIVNEDVGNTEAAYIRITKVLNEEETRKKIDEIVTKNKEGQYASEIEVPENCHLEMIFYDVRYTSETKSYININLCSVDGSEFRYRGVKYSPKTYDLKTETKEENDWIVGKAVYFIVPNGCSKYGFKCSGIMDSPELQKAWFLVGDK